MHPGMGQAVGFCRDLMRPRTSMATHVFFASQTATSVCASLLSHRLRAEGEETKKDEKRGSMKGGGGFAPPSHGRGSRVVKCTAASGEEMSRPTRGTGPGGTCPLCSTHIKGYQCLKPRSSQLFPKHLYHATNKCLRNYPTNLLAS
jgi:hypothetical protein